ncbi:TPA: HBL/NHE enterotoxin family protein [Bacillus cereus]|nr:HBL/NHE enterotoxin family protein [Bacillus cereus]
MKILTKLLVIFSLGFMCLHPTISHAASNFIPNVDKEMDMLVSKRTRLYTAINDTKGILDASLIAKINAQSSVVYDSVTQWQNEIKHKINPTVDSILNYNANFNSKYNEITQAASKKDVQTVLQLLKQVQGDITGKQSNVVLFLSDFKNFNNKIIDSTREFQSFTDTVKAVKVAKQNVIDTLYNAGAQNTSQGRETIQKVATELHMVDTLHFQLATHLQVFQGSNGWIPSPGLLGPLEKFTTNWYRLQAKISGLIDAIDGSSSSVDSVFLEAELRNMKVSWDDVYNQAKIL